MLASSSLLTTLAFALVGAALSACAIDPGGETATTSEEAFRLPNATRPFAAIGAASPLPSPSRGGAWQGLSTASNADGACLHCHDEAKPSEGACEPYFVARAELARSALAAAVANEAPR